MAFIEHYINQTGKVLSVAGADNKIVVNKYDNDTSRIFFNLDGTIEGRLYVALKNPKTGKYKFTPLIQKSYIIVTTTISRYPGLWEMILVGVEDPIEDDELDESKTTFVSNPFKRLLVKDNFLDDDQIEYVHDPAIDHALDDMVHAQESIIDAAANAQEAREDARAIADTVDEKVTRLEDFVLTEHTFFERFAVDSKNELKGIGEEYSQKLKSQYETELQTIINRGLEERDRVHDEGERYLQKNEDLTETNLLEIMALADDVKEEIGTVKQQAKDAITLHAQQEMDTIEASDIMSGIFTGSDGRKRKIIFNANGTVEWQFV